MRESSPLAHIDDGARLLPGPAAVCAAADAHIYIVLQVVRGGVAYVIDRNQSALWGGDQTGDAVGEHPVVHIVLQGHAVAVSA